MESWLRGDLLVLCSKLLRGYGLHIEWLDGMLILVAFHRSVVFVIMIYRYPIVSLGVSVVTIVYH